MVLAQVLGGHMCFLTRSLTVSLRIASYCTAVSVCVCMCVPVGGEN